jgi:hypothetical protein
MQKWYRGKTCPYCAQIGASESADHVFARQFFLKEDRANLPKVPSCEPCNRAKAELEHYLASVLPFGGRHADATKMLSEYVPGRLAKNARLHHELVAGQTKDIRVLPNGYISPEIGIPIDCEKLGALFAYVAKGLALHHWEYIIPPDANVRSGMITRFGAQFFEGVLAMKGRRIEAALGNSVLTYQAVQSVEQPQLSIWKFTPYGGLQLGGDPEAPDELVSDVWVLTTSAGMKSLWDLEAADSAAIA